MALEGNGDAGTMEIAFDAPQPYLAVATFRGWLWLHFVADAGLHSQGHWPTWSAKHVICVRRY